MWKRILVATDGSPTATRGLKTALALARDQKATLLVLHVIDSALVAQTIAPLEYGPAEYVDTLLEGMRMAGEKDLARAAALARAADQRIEPVLVESRGASVAETILGQARKLRADLIVLGTHGRRGVSRMVLGSDAEAVVRDANLPVLLVRAAGRAGATRKQTPTARPPPPARAPTRERGRRG